MAKKCGVGNLAKSGAGGNLAKGGKAGPKGFVHSPAQTIAKRKK